MRVSRQARTNQFSIIIPWSVIVKDGEVEGEEWDGDRREKMSTSA